MHLTGVGGFSHGLKPAEIRPSLIYLFTARLKAMRGCRLDDAAVTRSKTYAGNNGNLRSEMSPMTSS